MFTVVPKISESVRPKMAQKPQELDFDDLKTGSFLTGEIVIY